MAKNSSPFDGDENDPFAAARGRFGKATTNFEKIPEYVDRLLLLTPTQFHSQVSTSFGEADAVTANVVVLDGEGAPIELPGVMIFQKVIVGQLKGRIGGDPVLGVLVQRDPTKKGMSGAYVVDSDIVTDDQVKLALAYLDAKDRERGEGLKADADA